MSTSPQTIELSALDAFRAADLPPKTWDNNLIALRTRCTALARALATVELPTHWRPALGLDGAPTFRTEQPGEPAMWLGDTTIPHARAAALLEHYTHGGRNPALPALGAGHELVQLLALLPRHLAVFVFEPDLTTLAAILRMHDVAPDIQSGRCVIVPPSDPVAFLETYTTDHPGLQPPAQIILADLAEETWVSKVRAVCEQIGQTANTRLNTFVQKHEQSLLTAANTQSTPRLAIIAFAPHPRARVLAHDLAAAAQDLGWTATARTVSGPHDVQALAHAHALVDFRPTHTLCINHDPSLLPIATPRAAQWLLDEAAIPHAGASRATLLLAATPQITAQASEHHHTTLWPWACRRETTELPLPPPENYVLLAADLPDDNPESWGVRQTSHKRLWHNLRELTAKAWQNQRGIQNDQLLTQAEQIAELRITNPGLRAQWCDLIWRAIVPAVVLEQITPALTSASISVLAIGHGWHRLTSPHLTPYADDWFALHESGDDLHPRACILAGHTDPFAALAVHAAGRGWPLLVHRLAATLPLPALADVLHPAQHYACFGDTKTLSRLLDTLHSDAAHQRRMTRARRHIAEHHTWSHRLQALHEQLKHPPGEPAR